MERKKLHDATSAPPPPLRASERPVDERIELIRQLNEALTRALEELFGYSRAA